jgi:fibronectin-binding autotransporter adhesin
MDLSKRTGIGFPFALTGAALVLYALMSTMLNASVVPISSRANPGAVTGSLTFGGGTLQVTPDVTSLLATNTGSAGNTALFHGGLGKILQDARVLGSNGNLTLFNSGTLILSDSGSNGTGSTNSSGILSLPEAVTLDTGNFAFTGAYPELGNSNFTRALGVGVGQLNMNSASGGAGVFTLNSARHMVNSRWDHTNAETISNATTLSAAQTWSENSGNLVFDRNLTNRGFLLTSGGSSNTSAGGIISAPAAIVTWVAGGNSGDATDGGNWNTGGVPGSGDDVLFDNTSQSPIDNIFLNGSATINSVTINLTAASNQNWNLGAANDTNPFTLTLATGNISVLSTSGTGTYVIGATSGTGIGTGILTLATSGTGFTFDNSRTNGGLLQINATVSGGTKTVTKTGVGTVTLSGVNTYTGPTTISGGTLSVGTIGNGGVAGNLGQATNAAANLVFNGGTLRYTGATASTNRNFTINTGKTATFDITTNTLTVSGASTATNGALIKIGAGGLTLSGANTYTGATTVNGGTLTLANGSGSALGFTSAITVNSGGTLLLGASNQINNAATITLGGGTFAKGNFSEGSASTAGVGALVLSAAGSHLNFGTGTVGDLTFASFAPGGNTLTIDNWTGTSATVGTDGLTDRLIFASDQSGNLGSFNFTGFGPGAVEFNLGNGYFEITPVPEAGTYFSGAIVLALILFHHRRQLRQLVHGWRASRKLRFSVAHGTGVAS